MRTESDAGLHSDQLPHNADSGNDRPGSCTHGMGIQFSYGSNGEWPGLHPPDGTDNMHIHKTENVLEKLTARGLANQS